MIVENSINCFYSYRTDCTSYKRYFYVKALKIIIRFSRHYIFLSHICLNLNVVWIFNNEINRYFSRFVPSVFTLRSGPRMDNWKIFSLKNIKIAQLYTHPGICTCAYKLKRTTRIIRALCHNSLCHILNYWAGALHPAPAHHIKRPTQPKHCGQRYTSNVHKAVAPKPF